MYDPSKVITEPIIILGMPRSGSSMTAGVFANHGVWTGRCRGPTELNRKGHFESKAIKEVIMGVYGAKAIVTNGRLAHHVAGFKTAVLSAIAKDGYSGGDWLWKGSALYWPSFYEFHPKWVICKRPSEQIFVSCRRSGIFGKYLTSERLKEVIEIHVEQMAHLKKVAGAFEVDTHAVANGDYESIELALEGCGIEPNREVIDSFVDCSLWHVR